MSVSYNSDATLDSATWVAVLLVRIANLELKPQTQV